MPAGHWLIQQRPPLTMESGEAQDAEVLAERKDVLQPSALHERARTVIGVVCAPAIPSSVLLTLPIVDALTLNRFTGEKKPATSLPPASRTLTASVGATSNLL